MTKYSFKARVWKTRGSAGWFFVTLPKKTSALIRKKYQQDEEGWGRLKAEARIGRIAWKTSIWFDSKIGSYLLPLKIDIRRKTKITNGSVVAITLSFRNTSDLLK